jgi:hypothetical protein
MKPTNAKKNQNLTLYVYKIKKISSKIPKIKSLASIILFLNATLGAER